MAKGLVHNRTLSVYLWYKIKSDFDKVITGC